jgi:hypothetical protein
LQLLGSFFAPVHQVNEGIMTELEPKVKKNNSRKIKDLASGAAKSLIYKGM